MVVRSSHAEKIGKAKRSITVEKGIEAKARLIQARLIEKTDKSWSMSAVLNMLMIAGLLQTKKMVRGDWQRVRDILEKGSVSLDDSLIDDFVRKVA